MVTAKPSMQLPAAMNKLKRTPHALTLATFENRSINWYELYQHPNTRNVIHLSHCYDELTERICGTHGSSILTQVMTQAVESFDSKRNFYQV